MILDTCEALETQLPGFWSKILTVSGGCKTPTRPSCYSSFNVIVWKLENAVTLWFFLLQPEISIP